MKRRDFLKVGIVASVLPSAVPQVHTSPKAEESEADFKFVSWQCYPRRVHNSWHMTLRFRDSRGQEKTWKLISPEDGLEITLLNNGIQLCPTLPNAWPRTFPFGTPLDKMPLSIPGHPGCWRLPEHIGS